MKYLPFLVLFLGFPLLALATTTDTSFVPLTNIPFIEATGDSYNLENFLNGLYKICIGAAAVLAVLQIMRAGILYMGGDSVTEKKEAKNLIAMSIGGLILVLSPVIVFSIINPEILSLKINKIEELAVPAASSTPDTLSEQLCSMSTGHQFVTPSTGMSCESVLDGGGWVRHDTSCCAGTPGAGQICCGRDKNYTPPPVSPGSQPFHYKFVARDTTPPACQLAEATRGFDTKEACITDMNATMTSSNQAVVTENCDNQTQSPPIPANHWATLQGLPRCSE